MSYSKDWYTIGYEEAGLNLDVDPPVDALIEERKQWLMGYIDRCGDDGVLTKEAKRIQELREWLA